MPKAAIGAGTGDCAIGVGMASTQPRAKGRAVPWPYILSILLHGAAALTLLLMPGQSPSATTRPAPLKVTLVDPPPPKARPATPPPPKPASPPAAKPVAPRPAAPAQPARPAPTAKPTVPPTASPPPRATPAPPVSPSPTATPADDKLAVLRSIPDLANLSDEELAAIELPPGLTSWQEFVKLAQEIGMFKAAFPPPTTGQTGGQAGGQPDGRTADSEPSGPTWHWEATADGSRGSIALDTGIVSILWPTGAPAVDVLVTGSDAGVAPIAFSLPTGPGSDREAVGQAVLDRLPQLLESATP